MLHGSLRYLQQMHVNLYFMVEENEEMCFQVSDLLISALVHQAKASDEEHSNYYSGRVATPISQ